MANFPGESLEERLRKLKTTIAPEPSLADDVLRRIESMPVPLTRHGGRIFMRVSAAIAACIIVGIIVVLAMSGDATTYARVIKALDRVKTMHAVGQMFYGDKQIGRNEYWYERGVGIKMVAEHFSGGRKVIFTDGKQAIDVEDGVNDGKPVIAPAKTDNETLLTRELTLDGLRSKAAAPEPSGDLIIDETRCRFFVWNRRPGQERTCYWIDPGDLLRRMEVDAFNPDTKQWQPNLIVDISYNVPIDPANLRLDPEILQKLSSMTRPATEPASQ